MAATQFVFKKAAGARLDLENSGDVGENSPFGMEKINFMNMGIGGLDTEFQQIFRRAFATRLYPAQVIENVLLIAAVVCTSHDKNIWRMLSAAVFEGPGCAARERHAAVWPSRMRKDTDCASTK